MAEAIQANPSQDAEAAELDSAFRRAFARLRPRQAEVFCLYELGEWSYQQIADQFGITVNSVGVILHRARQKLQELLKMQTRLSEVRRSQPRTSGATNLRSDGDVRASK